MAFAQTIQRSVELYAPTTPPPKNHIHKATRKIFPLHPTPNQNRMHIHALRKTENFFFL